GFKHEHEIFAVFNPEYVILALEARVFPVDIDAIEIILLNDRHARFRELFARRRSQNRIGKVFTPTPATDRDHDFEIRILLTKLDEVTKVDGVGCHVGKPRHAILYIDERIVEYADLFRGDSLRINRTPESRDIPDDQFRNTCIGCAAFLLTG